MKNLGTNEELLQALSPKEKVNYFLLNIDNFSNINSAYGYEMGNILLNLVAKYLTIIKPTEATLYRFCADRFIILDKRTLTHEQIARVCESILSFFAQTDLDIEDDILINISFSIGVSTACGSINITQAEIALDEMRESRRTYYNIFNPHSKYVHNQQQNIYWIQKIKEAVLDEEIVAYFQPIINNKTQKVEKYECLARLKDEDEIISPYLFLEAAKVTGSLPHITRSLITQSFEKFALTSYQFSINITGEDLSQEYLEAYLLKNVAKYKIDPRRVVLEILEDISTLDSGTTLSQLDRLRENGFLISIDDFGAENSNLSRLLEIKPDFLKIDGAFVKNIIEDRNSQIIVEAIVDICKKSGIEIIAEYVHNEEVFEKVRALGIEYSQGYFFGAPSPKLLET